jgi:hypothetical protein
MEDTIYKHFVRAYIWIQKYSANLLHCFLYVQQLN